MAGDTGNPPGSPYPPTPRQALIERGEQLVLILLGLAVVAGIGYRAIKYLRIGAEPMEVVPAATPSFQVDVNAADWVTLALVPGLGEALSKRIVEERERRGGRFETIDDLKSVRGIKDRTLDKLRPYLFVGSGAAREEPVRMTDKANVE